jgi:ribosomal protein L31E
MENIADVTDRHSLMAFLSSLNYQTEEVILDKELNLELSERAKDSIKSLALITSIVSIPKTPDKIHFRF